MFDFEGRAMFGKLEAAAQFLVPQNNLPISTEALERVTSFSQAISLKRIADALEKLAEPQVAARLVNHPWRKWDPADGGRIPTGRVQIMFRNGGDGGGDDAELYDWSHSGGPIDIVAYRRIEP